MAYSFDTPMPTPSPDAAQSATGTRYRRDQFPPAPRSVRIVTLSRDAGEPIGVAARGSFPKESPGCVFAGRPAAVWLAVAALCVVAVLAWAVLRTAPN